MTDMRIQDVLAQVKQEAAKVIIGQQDVLDQALIAICCGQHALIEGVPGVAKTLLVRTLAKLLGCDFGRIQFTPDLMPSDITGTTIFDMRSQEFKVMKGPVFTTFLLADEINRAPAKTQSALLQAMQERQVTLDRQTHPLPADFTVFATQNPVEYEGTYPLPEAQKDRFLLKIAMDMPGWDDELELARRMANDAAPEKALADGAITPVLAPGALSAVRAQLPQVLLRDELLEYIVRLVQATRRQECVLVGAGPRATQALVMASRAAAALDGRDFVTPDDAKGLARAVMAHRLLLRPEYEIEGLTCDEVVARVLEDVAVPR